MSSRLDSMAPAFTSHSAAQTSTRASRADIADRLAHSWHGEHNMTSALRYVMIYERHWNTLTTYTYWHTDILMIYSYRFGLFSSRVRGAVSMWFDSTVLIWRVSDVSVSDSRPGQLVNLSPRLTASSVMSHVSLTPPPPPRSTACLLMVQICDRWSKVCTYPDVLLLRCYRFSRAGR